MKCLVLMASVAISALQVTGAGLGSWLTELHCFAVLISDLQLSHKEGKHGSVRVTPALAKG